MSSNLGFSLRGFFFRGFFVVVHKIYLEKAVPKVYEFETSLEKIRTLKDLDHLEEKELVDLNNPTHIEYWFTMLKPTNLAPCLGMGGFAVVYFVAKSCALRVSFNPPQEGPTKSLAYKLFQAEYKCPLGIQELQVDELKLVDKCCFHVSIPQILRDNDLTLSEPVGVDLYSLIYKHTSTQLSLEQLLNLCCSTLRCYKCLRAKNLAHGDLTYGNFIFFKDTKKVLMIDLDSLVSVKVIENHETLMSTFECTDVNGDKVPLEAMNGTRGFCSLRPPGTSPFEEDAYAVLWVIQHLLSRVRLSSVGQRHDGIFTVSHVLTKPTFMELAIWIYTCHQKLQTYFNDPPASARSHALETFADATLSTFEQLLEK